MKSLKKLFRKNSTRRRRPVPAADSSSVSGVARHDSSGSLNGSSLSEDSGNASSRQDSSPEGFAAFNASQVGDTAATCSAQNAPDCDEVDDCVALSSRHHCSRGMTSSVSFPPDSTSRFEQARLENVQNQWHALTRDEHVNQNGHANGIGNDRDIEYAQNLQNEDSENIQSSQEVNSRCMALPPDVDVSNQANILNDIHHRQEQAMTSSAIQASLETQFDHLAQQQSQENGWRLETPVVERDQPDGSFNVNRNVDWSRLLSFTEWKDAAYTTFLTLLVPIILVGYIFYYLVKGLEGIAKFFRAIHNFSSRFGPDTTGGPAPPRRSQAAPGLNTNIDNPLMLLILPIMLPIWILQGMSKAAAKVNPLPVRPPPARPRSHFRMPSFNWRLGQGTSARLRVPQPRPMHFNGNRPCKCRCNECSIM